MCADRQPTVEYVADAAIDGAVDREIRDLLCQCFTKPQDAVFRERRYFREPYPHRWVIRDDAGRMVAHVGVHEKRIEADGEAFPIAGIAEVCVHPDCRGRGYVRALMQTIHAWFPGRGFVFSVLFGNPRVYGSSGYAEIHNLLHDTDRGDGLQRATAMVRPLTDRPWPSDDVVLPGPTF